MAVRFLPEVHIERAAEALLVEYGRKFGEVAAPPVPVEEIIECHFDLSLGFDDPVFLGPRGLRTGRC